MFVALTDASISQYELDHFTIKDKDPQAVCNNHELCICCNIDMTACVEVCRCVEGHCVR